MSEKRRSSGRKNKPVSRKDHIPVPSPNSEKADVKMVPPVDSRYLDIGIRLAFFLFCLVFLGIANADYFFLFGEYTLFLENTLFFQSHFSYASGPLLYVARFFAQFFCYPLVGIPVLSFFLSVLEILTAKLFRSTGALRFLSFLPAFLVLHLFTQVDFLTFDEIIDLNYLYAALLGISAALLFALTCSRIDNVISRTAFFVLGSVLFYYLVGFYGLIGSLLCILRELARPNENRRMLRVELMTLFALLTPMIFNRFVYSAPFERQYLIGIPFPLGWGVSYWPFLALPVVVSALQVFDLVRRRKVGMTLRISVFAVGLNVVFFLFFCVACWFFSHLQPEFLATARMCRLLKENDWQGILDVRFSDPRPVRPIVLIRNLALFKLGRLGEEAFTFPQNSKVNDRIFKYKSFFVFGNAVFYEYGAVNTARRISLDQEISRGLNRNSLEMYVRCALVNGEEKPARTYLAAMEQSPVMKGRARMYRDYLDKSETPFTEKLDREIRSLRRLRPDKDRFEGQFSMDQLIADWFFGREFEASPEEIREAVLFTLLQRKNLTTFRRQLDEWMVGKEDRTLPKHFQEAILIGSKDRAADTEKYRLSSETVRRFEDYRTSNPATKASKFSDTYWQFYDNTEKNVEY